MIAAAGFLAQEAATGATWGQGDFSFENLLLGPLFKQEAVELARECGLAMLRAADDAKVRPSWCRPQSYRAHVPCPSAAALLGRFERYRSCASTRAMS